MNDVVKFNDEQGRGIRNDENGFHSTIFFLDENYCVSSMFVSLMTNTPKCTSRLCRSTEYFFRAAEAAFTQENIK